MPAGPAADAGAEPSPAPDLTLLVHPKSQSFMLASLLQDASSRPLALKAASLMAPV
jgi:hypothetical protein